MTHCKKISKFVSKFTIFRKIENLFFQLQQIFFLRILNAKFTWIIWIFAPKIVNQQKWKVYNLTIFWRENSNWNYNLQWFKFIIVLFLLENSIFGYNLRFSKTKKKSWRIKTTISILQLCYKKTQIQFSSMVDRLKNAVGRPLSLS